MSLTSLAFGDTLALYPGDPACPFFYPPGICPFGALVSSSYPVPTLLLKPEQSLLPAPCLKGSVEERPAKEAQSADRPFPSQLPALCLCVLLKALVF